MRPRTITAGVSANQVAIADRAYRLVCSTANPIANSATTVIAQQAMMPTISRCSETPRQLRYKCPNSAKNP